MKIKWLHTTPLLVGMAVYPTGSVLVVDEIAPSFVEGRDYVRVEPLAVAPPVARARAKTKPKVKRRAN